MSEEPEAEIAAFDICACDDGDNEAPDAQGWLRLNLDTGAAATVWPIGQNYGKEIKAVGEGPKFRTATGERLEAKRRVRVGGRGEWGQQIGLRGWETQVRKPLVAAGEVTDAGSLIVLDQKTGHIIGNEELKWKMRKLIETELAKDASNVVPVHKEKGVYNMYVKVQAKGGDICAAEDLDPWGFPRLGSPP